MQAAWITSGCLLLAGRWGNLNGTAPSVSHVVDRTATPLPARLFSGANESAADGVNGTPGVLVVLGHGAGLGTEGELAIEAGDQSFVLTADSLKALAGDADDLVRRVLAPLGAKEREALLEFLAATLQAVPEPDRPQLSNKLFRIREALRERLPEFLVSKADSRGIHVDRILAADERSFYIDGWLYHEGRELRRLTAVSPEGGRVELADRLFRYSRSDVSDFFSTGAAAMEDEIGFICFFELPGPSLRADGWVLEVELDGDIVSQAGLPTVLSDTLEVRKMLLDDPFIERLPDDELTANHVFPAISRIQDRLSVDEGVDSVLQLGAPPEAPAVSIVIPLYKQLAHVEVQLALFADDPELAGADLIYVLDSPEQEVQLRDYAADLFQIYRIPLRIGFPERNLGFAGACNAGAQLARGRLLLLMNSDVLPDQPGWLGRMADFFDATPNVGALGPKLLYEDDSIQHAGMYYHHMPGSSAWVDAHYFKGMHRSLPAANVARRVPLLSGACLMVDRSVYERLGGFPRKYVQGDYEDSDFCLQLSQAGLENWYTPAAELYHLEGQSYSADVRRPANRYNMWVHSHQWSKQIEAVMGEYSEGPEGGTTASNSS